MQYFITITAAQNSDSQTVQHGTPVFCKRFSGFPWLSLMITRQKVWSTHHSYLQMAC